MFLRFLITICVAMGISLLDVTEGTESVKIVRNKQLKNSYEILEITGEKMCIKNFRSRTNCKSVNHSPKLLRCELNCEVAKDTSEDFINSDTYNYLEIGEEEKTLCNDTDAMCLNFNNQQVCISKARVGNVALDKNGSQSSVWVNDYTRFGPEFAISSQKTWAYPTNCSQSKSEKDPWYQVDLKDKYIIEAVKINPGWQPLHNAEVRIGDNTAWSSKSVCNVYNGSSYSAVMFNCRPPIKGQFVQCMIHGNSVLNICEFEVHAWLE